MIEPFALTISVLALALDAHSATLLSHEIEFPFDDEVRLLSGANAGKVWRSSGLPTDGTAVPLVIFMHGIIFDGLRHHWLTIDRASAWGDARPFMSSLTDEGYVAPLLMAVPSQTRDATDPSRLFEKFDFDRFVDSVDHAVSPHQRVDRERVVVVGHSASACYEENAAMASLRTKTFRPLALVAIDGCLSDSNATLLSTTRGARHVIVTYQDRVWPRPFDEFRTLWEQAVVDATPMGLRILERYDFESDNAHLELVEITLRRWLPRLIPPAHAPQWTTVPRILTLF